MSASLSAERLAEIRARDAAATEGPWEPCPGYGPTFYGNVQGEYLRAVGDINFGVGEQADADLAFTLGARRDVPVLLAEIDQIAVVLAQSEQELTGARLSLWEEEQVTRRLRVAWGMARTRARSAMSGADRYAKRARELQNALQETVFGLIGMQIERDAAHARVAELDKELREARAAVSEQRDDLVHALGRDGGALEWTDLVEIATGYMRSAEGLESPVVTELFLAEYGDDHTSLHTTLADAQKRIDEWAAPYAEGRGYEWEEDEDGIHVQVWTDPETDRALHRTLGSVLSLTVQGAPELTVFRASYPESGMTLGEYTTRKAAMDHVHHLLAREESTTAAAIELRVIWRADGPDADDTAWECWLHDEDGAEGEE